MAIAGVLLLTNFTEGIRMIVGLWMRQQIERMESGISAGKTRRRKADSFRELKVSEAEIKQAVEEKGWRVAQIGNDYVFAPRNYTIRPIV